jgi:pilus assembly protein FimV
MTIARLRPLLRQFATLTLATLLAISSITPALAAAPPAPAPTAAAASVGTPVAAPASSTPAEATPPASSALAAPTAASSPAVAATSSPAAATPSPDAAITPTAGSAPPAVPASTSVAVSGGSTSSTTALIQQLNIQIIQGTPNPVAPVSQSASNSATVAQSSGATTGQAAVSPGSAPAAGTAAAATTTTGNTATTGSAIAAALAIIQQINIQIITGLAGSSAASQVAENVVVVNQDSSAQSGNAAAAGSGTGTTGTPSALANAQIDQKSIQLYTGDTAILTGAGIAALIAPYLLGGSSSTNLTTANATQQKSDTTSLSSNTNTATGVSPSATPGTGSVVATGGTGDSSAGSTAASGDALARAIAYVAQINVQLIAGLLEGAIASQTAKNTLVVDQNLQAVSGNATAGGGGGSATSGNAAATVDYSLAQGNGQATLQGSGATMPKVDANTIASLIDAILGPNGGVNPGVGAQSAQNNAVVAQSAEVRVTPTPVPTPIPTTVPTAEPTTVATAVPTKAPVTASPSPTQRPPAPTSTVAPAAPRQSSGSGQPASCRYQFGFATLHQAIPEIVGECRTDEVHADNGDAVQLTTRGILVWRKADNYTAFTDGKQVWILGLTGLQTRAGSR